jgi:starch-binding outer membrane protein, SusD/RagB family
MKKYQFIWTVMFGIAVIAISGCEKFLDRKPLTATLNDYAQGGLEPQSLGLYGALRNSAGEPYTGDGFQSIPWIGINGFRSDDQEIVSDPGAAQWHATYDNFNYTKDDWASGVYWEKHYVLIGNCNTILQIADSLKLTNDVNTKVNIAEARWFRALSYWDLVRNYGEIPKIDFRIYNPNDANIAKSPEAAILALIESDLQYASINLPLSWPSKFAGRLTSGTAKALLAKVYMWKQKWAPALAACKEVIQSGQYDLVKPYWSIWKTENELSKESLFEVQAAYAPGDGGQLWSWFGTAQGVRGNGADGWNLGWGWNTPTANLVNAYESGDPRKAASILFSGQSDDAANGGYGKTLPPYTNALYWNKKAYTSDAERAGSGDLNGSYFYNFRMLRYADVLLTAAEAANETGDGPLAETYLEMIRDRARNGNNSILPKVVYVNQAQMRTAIKKERRVEFGVEFERFWDLIRWGDAQSVLSGLGYQAKNHWYPLPSGAISSNPKLVQNPDYP